MMCNISKKEKNNISEEIINIRVGNIDISGNHILHVLAKYDYFAIYEIQSDSIQSKIRVTISSNDKKIEEKIRQRYHLVKNEYIKTKNALLHTSNYDENKHLIAHTLATYLDNDIIWSEDNTKIKGEEEGVGRKFIDIKEDIYRKNELILKNKLAFIFPSFFIVFFMLVLSIIYQDSQWKLIFMYSCATALGNAISVSTRAMTRNFQEFELCKDYIFVGIKRLCFAIVMAGAFFIILKAKIITISFLNMDDCWQVMMGCLLAGFSERLIPALLSKSENIVITEK